MEASAALVFAFDWPLALGLPRCCTCGRMAFSEAAAIGHLDTRHPGWLDRWNAALRNGGIVG
jgi:hypothetical protein